MPRCRQAAMTTVPSPEALLRYVRESAEGFEVFGELGRHDDSDIWYLARDQDGGTLVALRLKREGEATDGSPEYSLEITRELSGSVALALGDCPACGAPLRAWARFCGKCGADVAGRVAAPSNPAERATLLAEVRAAAGDVYEVLGEMPWAGGGGIVYFAVEKESGRLVRLRLTGDAEGMALGETRVMVPLERLDAAYVSHASVTSMPAVPHSSSTEGAPVPPPSRTQRTRTPLLVAGVAILVILLVVLALL